MYDCNGPSHYSQESDDALDMVDYEPPAHLYLKEPMSSEHPTESRGLFPDTGGPE